jgi:hypothetical protein
MNIHSLELADSYSLIGIYTAEEDYRLAFLINKHLNTKFYKYKDDLDFKNSIASFSIFKYINKTNRLTSYLVSNKFIGNGKIASEANLFSNEVLFSQTMYLISEKKKVDYFLKIEGDISTRELNNTIGEINKIKQVITSYKICPSNLKSKDFLTF